MSEALLSVENLCVSYGPIQAVKNISLQVFKGEIVSIIGSNGAGKTTSMQAISGLIPIKSGKVIFKGRDITHLKGHQILKHGLAQSPEGRMVFPNLTVAENLEMGHYTRSDLVGIKRDKEFIFDLFPKLKARSFQLAGTLSGGEQQMLAIGRSYLSAPDLLILDEPSLGIAPILVQNIMEAIATINREGKSIILVEQNAHLALKKSKRGYVLVNGEITLQGESSCLLSNDQVKKAYLGF